MSEPQTDKFNARGPDDEAVIEAVGYTPVSESRERSFPLSPLQIGLVLVAIPIIAVLWFLFTARSVSLEFSPAAQEVDISGGVSFELGGVHLLSGGEYRIRARAEGYFPLGEPIVVGDERSQTFEFAFTRLPGRVTFVSEPGAAEISLAGTVIGSTPSAEIQVPAGNQTVTLTKPRYQRLIMEVEIEGLDRAQSVSGELLPDWAEVTIASIPAGAEIFLDDESTGQLTPATVEVLSGEHEIRIKTAGHKSHRQRILVAALETIALPEVTLQQADGIIAVTSRPAGAGVTLNGRFQGETPMEIAVKSATDYRVQVFKAGFAPRERSLSLSSGEERSISLDLNRLTGKLVVQADPADAELLVDGRPRGQVNQTLTLPTVSHRIEIRLPGYAGYSTTVTPRNGLTQELKVKLLTLEEARLAAMKPEVKSAQGHELVLLSPHAFTMGASRREPGRRANETLREVEMARLFYLGRHEVSNAQFKAFAPGHDSGEFQEHALDKDDMPVVDVSWEEAALYCNWLSKQDGLPVFYRTEFGKVTGINITATGYRLPTEAEWAWSARQTPSDGKSFRFPWGGNLPPPDRHGNYADRSASHLVGRIIFGYNDNHIAAAEVGTFAADANGVYDLAGNVSEWISDFYEIPGADKSTDPLGPETGDYHVIRGSSWMHGTITDLRLSYRDYGTDGRNDLGFRIARFVESS
ncbi:MAG: PEGA domain-containing protein [Gammaproteobacteria bacterium]|nr:PEGA domain-containing protein [Gammaproteobacteria bacterium]